MTLFLGVFTAKWLEFDPKTLAILAVYDLILRLYDVYITPPNSLWSSSTSSFILYLQQVPSSYISSTRFRTVSNPSKCVHSLSLSSRLSYRLTLSIFATKVFAAKSICPALTTRHRVAMRNQDSRLVRVARSFSIVVMVTLYADLQMGCLIVLL
jgi:hypothetical protein